MRKWFAILLTLTLLWISIPVSAQGNGHLSSVSVDIWPEYDQPDVLVIYHISLSTDISLPTTFNLRIPAGAEVYAVAVSNPTSGLLNAQYSRTVQGTWATLAITTNEPDLQVEYYDALTKTGTARHIVYEWAGDYAVDGFIVSLQQPVGAINLVTDPKLTSSNVAQDGFVYYGSVTQPLAAGQTYSLTIDYQKNTDTLSTTGLPVQPAQPLNSATPGRVTVNSVLPWVLAGIGGALIVVGVVGGLFMWKGGNRNTNAKQKQRAKTQNEEDNNMIYCNQCGKRAQPGDVFCRNCGTRIQKEGDD